jgi:uncharacterized SAM-binding protein YcdF (DUF218 family)
MWEEKLRISGIIVVLGAPNDESGRLSTIALERCSQAHAEYSMNPEYAILPTGGWGTHFNTTDKAHGYYVTQELIERGIPESAFLPVIESSNTIEDAKLSRAVIEALPAAELIVVTSDFHEARARYLFTREYPGRQLRMSTSTTELPPDELASLQEHEQKALKILKGNR